MVCLGFEPGAAGWKAQMNPLSYGGTPLFVYFCLFKQTSLQLLQQIYVKNVHPVYSTRIQTHNLWNTSLLP